MPSLNDIQTRIMKAQMKAYPETQARSINTFKQAKTKAIDVGGVKFAYRELGPDTGVPVIFLNHLAAELDRWDPRVVDRTFDNRFW